jgi:hypothetical protein
MTVKSIVGAYALQIEQPTAIIIKVGDTAMIAEALGVNASTPEELIDKVSDHLGLDKSCLKILSLAEVEEINKSADKITKTLKII